MLIVCVKNNFDKTLHIPWSPAIMWLDPKLRILT